jgi:hypothetical protein
MRRVVLGSLLSFACLAYAQQPVGDVYESGSGAETLAQAVQKLYDLTAEITANPSSGYDAQTDRWPEEDAAWQQWDNSDPNGSSAAVQKQRTELAACAAHLSAAIDAAERSYRVQKSQPNNSAAQADAQKLLGTARSDFEQCNLASALNGSNGNPAPGTNSPGNEPGGTSGGVPGSPQLGSPGTPQSATPPSNSGAKPTLKTGATSGPSQGSPGQQPTATNGTPDPNNRTLGIIVGLGNCIQSLPNLLSGLGYFMQGDFVDAAKSWGIDPKLGGPTVVQKELSVPVIGNNGQSLVPNNLTPYQQGVIDGQRLCGYTLSGLAGKGLGAVAKNVVGKAAPALKGGVRTTGPKPAGGAPGEPGAPGGNGAEPAQPAQGEPNGQPPAADKTPVTNPDKTPVTNPAPSASEPAAIKGGVSAQDPIQGNALKSALTNNGPNNVSDAPALANKYVQLSDGPVKLGDYINQGSFASVFKDGANLVRKVAKNSGAGYFNDQLEGQANGSQVLQKLGIDHPAVTEFEPGNDNEPASLVQQNTAQKYPGSQELGSANFQKASAAMQNQMLAAVKSVFDKLASNGYVIGDINPANFTIFSKGGVLEAIPHDTDMIMTLDQINKAFRDPTSTARSVLNGSLGASGADPYVPGSYASAEALANQLFIGLEDWLYNGPKAPPAQ